MRLLCSLCPSLMSVLNSDPPMLVSVVHSEPPDVAVIVAVLEAPLDVRAPPTLDLGPVPRVPLDAREPADEDTSERIGHSPISCHSCATGAGSSDRLFLLLGCFCLPDSAKVSASSFHPHFHVRQCPDELH